MEKINRVLEVKRKRGIQQLSRQCALKQKFSYQNMSSLRFDRNPSKDSLNQTVFERIVPTNNHSTFKQTSQNRIEMGSYFQNPENLHLSSIFMKKLTLTRETPKNLTKMIKLSEYKKKRETDNRQNSPQIKIQLIEEELSRSFTPRIS